MSYLLVQTVTYLVTPLVVEWIYHAVFQLLYLFGGSGTPTRACTAALPVA